MESGDSVGLDAERVARLISSLSIPDPWSLVEFIDDVAADRGRPIRLVPLIGDNAEHSPCGLLVACERDDVILYSSSTSEYHVEQIILHELGHLLLDHGEPASAGPSLEAITDLVPNIGVDTVRRVLGRTWYDCNQEREAELFASLMLSQGQPRAQSSGILDILLG